MQRIGNVNEGGLTYQNAFLSIRYENQAQLAKLLKHDSVIGQIKEAAMLVKWDPYTEIEKTFDNVFRSPFWLKAHWDDRNADVFPWKPAVNVYEDEENLAIAVQVPGMDKRDVNLSVNDHTLEISGERKADSKVGNSGYHVQEFRYGAFLRRFQLPSYVDPEKLKATYERGILTVTVPKHEKAKPRVIEVEGK